MLGSRNGRVQLWGMDIFALVKSYYFWTVFGLSGAAAIALIIAAAREASAAYPRYPDLRQKNVRPPGVWGITVAGTRIVVWGGAPCVRIFHAETWLDFVCHEPTLIVWYAAGWFVILEMWIPALYCFIAVSIWRVLRDVLFEPVPVGAPDLRLGRCIVHCMWAAVHAMFYACLSACVVVLVLAVISALAFAGSGGKSGGDRRGR